MTNPTDTLIVDTSTGKLRGRRMGGVHAWLNIPYAAPPVGPLRFREPQPVQPWTGIRDATRFGASALQPPLIPGPLNTVISSSSQFSEDCLYLNVWSPAADGRKRPVWVWIHGGAYDLGGGSQYLGHELAKQGDIVFVSINYRLNAFGFLNLGGLFEDERFAHNAGLLDQVAALRWVKENIEAFGGDPTRVTIGGESAGSASVVTLMVMKAARGLFHGAIAQSAGMSLHADWNTSLDIAQEFASQLGVGRDNRDQLWSLPAPLISRAMQRTKKTRPEGLTTRPYFDGHVLPPSLKDARAIPTPNIPLLIGTNLDEHRFFSVLRLPIMPLKRPRLANLLTRRLGAERADKILALYPDTERGLTDLGSHAIFTMPSIHFSEQHAQHAPTWRYRLDYPSPFLGLGAMHALDLFLLFPFPPGLTRLLLGKPTPELEALAQRMKRHWLRFVREGRPEEGWPAYDLETRKTLLLNLEDELVADPEGERRRAWAERDVMPS
ncbi:carboxylesterase/lipase family protein [Cystobacter ferrugineus]|uniref:Carboxylic ester hydrolase n=1 Tax=Cystobacter ferrugineus TaxID=83449 RepID=A0A1L9B4Z8_9BACT|nr:carboxylesterase/lipase family protein [Cystobacter ferrugineus]OJH37325.1 hypothetical protein BON30_28945 [Cystobacter ferrugineus]